MKLEGERNSLILSTRSDNLNEYSVDNQLDKARREAAAAGAGIVTRDAIPRSPETTEPVVPLKEKTPPEKKSSDGGTPRE